MNHDPNAFVRLAFDATKLQTELAAVTLTLADMTVSFDPPPTCDSASLKFTQHPLELRSRATMGGMMFSLVKQIETQIEILDEVKSICEARNSATPISDKVH